jgi:hypothetical protein
MTDDELVASARAGDAEARRALVERASLRTARAILGDKPAERAEALRELARGEEPAPALGPLLAAIGGDGDGEVRRAAELLYRARTDRWGPPERAAIGRFAAQNGARLGPEHALELLEWVARYPGDAADFVRGAAAGLGDVAVDAWERLAWRGGFEELVLRERERTGAWAAAPASARAVARALLSGHAREKQSCVPALEAIWERTPRRDVWAAALGEATAGNRGMRGRAEIAAWGWRRFCEREAERRELYAAFAPWREDWIELRNATPAERRPGGSSAVAHLQLWAGLDVEQLAATVEEAVRLARDVDWAALVDAAFDLAEAAPAELRRHALAGACRMAHEVTNRAREREALPEGIAAGAERLVARAEALARRLRETGAVLDPIVANRAEDLDVDVRLIREAQERRNADAASAAERAERDRRAAQAAEDARRQAEEARRQAEEARRRAEEARRRAEDELRRHLATVAGGSGAGAGAAGGLRGPLMPAIAPDPIDDEVFFASLPAPSLLAYARMFKRLTSGAPDAMQSLAAEGVSMEMIAVINQTWSTLFARRTDLAIRFSTLIAAAWA